MVTSSVAQPVAQQEAQSVGLTDVLVIGAGPVGLYAAFYAGFRGLGVTLVDSLPEAGGQVTAMYPEKLIYDVAGFPAVLGRDLVTGLVDQAARWSPVYLLGRQARGLVPRPDGEPGWRVTFADGDTVDAGAVLVTAGIGEFTPKPLPAGGEWLGRGLMHFVTSPGDLVGMDVVIVGGGDSAFDWALMLHAVARSVTLVHRRDTFRAHAGTVAEVRAAGVPIRTGCQVAAIDGDDRVASVQLRDGDGVVDTLPAQAVVAALGFNADLGPIREWGLELAKRDIAVDTTMRTSRERVYAAGDVATYPGKVKLIATGFGEAATAVNNIAVTLDPAAHLFPGHSSAV